MRKKRSQTVPQMNRNSMPRADLMELMTIIPVQDKLPASDFGRVERA